MGEKSDGTKIESIRCPICHDEQFVICGNRIVNCECQRGVNKDQTFPAHIQDLW